MRLPLLSTLTAFVCILAGCGSLPDARPFADASHAMALSVQASGKAVSGSLRGTANRAQGTQSGRYQGYASQLDDAWAARVQAAQGAVAYSEAISELLAAGNAGADTAHKIGTQLTQLAAVSGIPIAAPVAGATGDLFAFLSTRIAIVHASKSLEEAIQQAQPIIDRITMQLAADARRLQPILRNAYDDELSNIGGDYDIDLDYKATLRRKRTAAYDSIQNGGIKMSELAPLDQALAANDTRLKERAREIDKATEAYRAREALLDALIDTTSAWASAHRDLAAAVREKRKVTVTELQDSVAELRELVSKVRAL